MHCPSSEQLQRLLAEPPAVGDSSWDAHIERCELCQRLLEDLTNHAELLGTELPDQDSSAVDLDPVVSEDSLVRWKRLIDPRIHDDQTLGVQPIPASPYAVRDIESAKRHVPPGYEILAELGRGGTAVVYRARHLRLDRDVALKMILAQAHAGRDEIARFLGEAKTLAQFQHPNIVQVFDVGEHDGVPFIALELVEGGTLASWLADNPLPPRQAARLLELLARATDCVHQRGIIHRDLTPTNVLYTRLSTDDGEAATPVGRSAEDVLALCSWKITDFGLAKRLDSDVNLTRTGMVAGTPNYLAPEQAAGQPTAVGPSVDIYALGAILYRMLTGTSPFPAATPLETLQRVLHDSPIPPRKLHVGVPRDLETICLKCVQKNPRSRYASAEELADDLRRFLDGRPIRGRRTPWWEASLQWTKRNPMVAALAVAVVALLLVSAGILARSSWQVRNELARSLQAEQEASDANRVALDRLRQSRLATARAVRFSRQAGHRFDSLEALAEASKLADAVGGGEATRLELRNEAIAALAYPDIRLLSQRTVAAPFDVGAALDPVHARYAYGSSGGTIAICDAHNDQILAGFPTAQGTAFLRFSPDGSLLAAVIAEANSGSPAYTGIVWRMGEQREVFRVSNVAGEQSCAFSPDSRRIAFGRSDSMIQVFNAETGEELLSLDTVTRPARIVFSPDGQRVAGVAHQGKRIRIYDCQQSDSPSEFVNPAPVLSLDWRADGRMLVAGCQDGRIYVWNLASDRISSVLDGHRSSVIQVAFNREGTLLASQSWDGTTRLWDADGGRELVRAQTLWVHQWNAGGDLLAGGAAAAFQVWEVAGTDVCRHLYYGAAGNRTPAPESVGPWSTTFSENAELLLAAGGDGVRIWDPATGRELGHLPIGPTESVLVQTDGSLLTHARGRLLRWPTSRALRDDALEIRIGVPRELSYPLCSEFADGAGRLAQSRLGESLAIADRGGEVAAVWDPGKPIENAWVTRRPHIADISLSPDGRWAAIGNWDGNDFQIWDLHSDAIALQTPARCAFAAFSPDGRLLATGFPQGLRVWSVGEWDEPRYEVRHQLSLLKCFSAFSDDSRLLAFAHSDRAVRLHEAATGKPLATLEAPEPLLISDIRFSPSGDQLAVATENHIIQLWNLRRLRAELAGFGLDWPQPPYPTRTQSPSVHLRWDGITQLAATGGAASGAADLGASTLPFDSDEANEFYRRGVEYSQSAALEAARLQFAKAYGVFPVERIRDALAWTMLRQGDVEGPLELWRSSLQGDSQDVWDLYRRASLALASGDDSAYRTDCRYLLDRFGSATEADTVERVAKICLLATDTVGDRKQLLRLSERAIAAKPHVSWYWLAKGLAMHRLGRFEASTAALRRGIELWQAYDRFADVEMLAILAMNHANLGELSDARKELDRAHALLHEYLRDDPSDTPGSNWHDWLMSTLLLEEARELIATEEK